jgi:hypothetical protein
VKASVFIATSLDGFIARANGDLDWLPPGGGEPHGYDEFMATVPMATSNHMWISCSNTSARYSCFPSFFVRADGIITGRLRRNAAGVLVSTVDTRQRIYDGTAAWRDRAMRGVFHSGTLVRDRRSEDRTRL